jgi:hypothetical protein
MAFLADRLARVKASPTMAITALATELAGAFRALKPFQTSIIAAT